MEQKDLTSMNQCKKRVKKWINGKRSSLTAVFAMGTVVMYGQSTIIPQEIITTGEAFRDFFLGDFALIILGIIWAGACIGFAFNKDSQRGKIAFITITISCIGLGLTQVIVKQFVSMGN